MLATWSTQTHRAQLSLATWDSSGSDPRHVWKRDVNLRFCWSSLLHSSSLFVLITAQFSLESRYVNIVSVTSWPSIVGTTLQLALRNDLWFLMHPPPKGLGLHLSPQVRKESCDKQHVSLSSASSRLCQSLFVQFSRVSHFHYREQSTNFISESHIRNWIIQSLGNPLPKSGDHFHQSGHLFPFRTSSWSPVENLIFVVQRMLSGSNNTIKDKCPRCSQTRGNWGKWVKPICC